MTILLFKLQNVPDDEPADVREPGDALVRIREELRDEPHAEHDRGR